MAYSSTQTRIPRLIIHLALASCFLCSLGQSGPAQAPIDLFNGKDLAGWKGFGGSAKQNWRVENGELKCTGEPGATWIHRTETYRDFELSLEFNLPENANSGVFIRSPLTGDPWVTGIEIQLLDDYGSKWQGLADDQYTGAIYGVLGPTRRVTKKAGQWQTMRIRCQGRRCLVQVNGQTVVDANLDKLAKTHAKKVPGLLRDQGLIGLQNHGDRVRFRKIRLLDLSPKE